MADAPVAAQRILRGVASTLSVQLRDQDGEAAAPVGTLTVDITRADGTALVTGGSTAGSSTDPRTYSLSAANNTLLDSLTAVWKDGGTERARTTIDVVGGFFFSVAEVEAAEPALGDITDAGTKQAKARRVREEVERECERVTARAFVPRYRRERVSGVGTSELLISGWAPRSVRSVRVYTTSTDYTAFTSDELAAVACRPHGSLVRIDGGVWADGCDNIVVEYEHGEDRPPEDLRRAAMTRFKFRYTKEKVLDLEQFLRFQGPDGSSADLGDIELDIEQRDVLRVYRAYSKRTPGLA